jgi:hypothetical protein
MRSHWAKVKRSLHHLSELDGSIKGWLDGDAYRFVGEYNAETERFAIVARIKGPIPDWGPLIGDVVHNLRSALDHLAFALNAKGYADTHGGAALPDKAVSDSEFPIFGHGNRQRTAEQLYEGARRKYEHMGSEAQRLLRNFQPYQRGADYSRDPLWVLHELSRIDKHRELVALASAVTGWELEDGLIAGPGQIGGGGLVYDGFVLHWWTSSGGPPEDDPESKVSRDVAFGEGTVLWNQPVVPSLRQIRDYLRLEVITPLAKLL